MMLNSSTLDQIVLASTAGGVLGSAFSIVASTAQRQAEEHGISSGKMMCDATLTSLAIGLCSGAMTFAFSAIDVLSVERVTPFIMFTLCFVTVAGVALAKLVTILVPRLFTLGKSN
jgi:hypothetical protein